VKEPKTRAGRRKIVLSEEGAAALRAQRAWQECHRIQSRLVFSSKTGKHAALSRLLDNWKATIRKAGLPESLRVHDLRHTCATLLLAAGVDPKTVAERLGHSSTQRLFETYAHVLPSMRQRAAAVLGGLLGGGSKPAVSEQPPFTEPSMGPAFLTR
jgi:integrase